MGKRKARDFEALLQETEEIVDNLESGELSLDAALKKYEQGIENLRQCAQLIGDAEEKVKLLIEKSEGVFELEDFDESDLDESEDD